jgi:hypothetical protein
MNQTVDWNMQNVSVQPAHWKNHFILHGCLRLSDLYFEYLFNLSNIHITKSDLTDSKYEYSLITIKPVYKAEDVSDEGSGKAGYAGG